MACLTSTGNVIGQNKPFVKKKYFTLNPGVRNNDYQHGVLNVKIKPEYRSENGIMKSGPGFNKNRIIDYLEVQSVKPFVKPSQLQKIRARRSGPFKYDITAYQKVYYARTDISLEDAINLLYATGMFEIVEPAYVNRMEYQPNDSLLDRQYYLGLIKAFQAWDITKGSAEVVIGIVDSGVDIDHPDIVDNLWHNEADPIDGIDNDGNGYVDDYVGWDFAGASQSDPNDGDNDPGITKGGGFSHGTSVGGLVGATPDNNIGLAGVGYHCKLLFTKHAADDMAETDPGLIDTYGGVLYVASMGVKAINCSWGSNFRSQIAQDIINYVAEDLDIAVIAAAGNSGSEEDNHYPSAYDNVLSVSSVDIQYIASSFTSFGRTVDIAAPGTNITLLEYDNDYGLSQGTSFSTPLVTGAAGLVRTFYPDLTAKQVTELIRVTANDTIYQVNSSEYKNKLGKGILDIQNALTDHPPSIRLEKFRLLNASGKTAELGEDAFFTANFKNYLWPSTDAMKVTLTSESEMVEVLKNQSVLGKMDMNQEITNTADPIKLRVNPAAAPNTRAYLLLEYDDTKFHDYQYVSLLLNPTFMNIEENEISSSIAQNGRIGYQDTEQSEGLGFVYDDENLLFEMGIILGNSASRIADNVRSTDNGYDDDFQSRARIKNIVPGDYSASENYGSFNDSKADSSANGVTVNYRSMVWKEEPNSQYFIVEYKINNATDSLLDNFYMGLYADWDISNEGQSDRASWNNELSMGYVYNADTASSTHLYGGIQLLTGKPNYYAIDNDETNPGNPFGVYDGFTDGEKFGSLSSGIARENAGFTLENGADVSHTVSSGPYSINPGDTIIVAFAIHGAKSLDELITSAKAADTMYNYTLKEQAPVVSDVVICYQDSAILTAEGASSYKWYKTKTGGEAFATGNQYITSSLAQDTTFYVSNSENSWESVRTPANVILRAIPDITLAGSPNLCEGDTVILIADEADSYLWSPGGETTQSLVVTDSGNYSVTVMDNELGCVSHSKVIKVKNLSSPTADFKISQNEIDKNKDVSITLTDESINAFSWFWEISNGKSSTEQNPTFTINTNKDLNIELTVTASSGCHDTTHQILTVTGLNNFELARDLKLFPNPVEDLFHFELTNEFNGLYHLWIYNLKGELLKETTFNKYGERYSGQIDLTGIPVGLYMVKISNSQAGSTYKRVVIR